MRRARPKAVVLLSGGLDSVTALHHTSADFEITAALFFDYGSKHNERELPFAAYHAAQLGLPHLVIPLRFIGEHFESALLQKGGAIPKGHYEDASMRQTVVPFRNGIMLAVAAGYAESRGAETLIIAAHAGDHAIYPDCRESFLGTMSEAIRIGTYAGIEIVRPFSSMTKREIVRRGEELGVDFAQTWSCYVGDAVHCGVCGTCVERREAFALAGVPDPTTYREAGPIPARPAGT